MDGFSIARLPRIEFGAGAASRVPAMAARYGKRALLVTGAHSFVESEHWARMREDLRSEGVQWQMVNVAGEPSPALVDDAVRAHATDGIDVVLAVGGGSALDAGKAIAGNI